MDTKVEYINSLADYIKLLEKYSATDYLFRGEHCHLDSKGNAASYDSRVAGAFRPKYKVQGKQEFADFMEPIKQFYYDVGHRVTEIEKQEFLAFSQHFGLDTNLLDVSENPLAALFFACQEEDCCKYKTDNLVNEGVVFIFSKKSFVDITEVVKTAPMEKDIFAEVPFKEMSKAFQKFFKNEYERLRTIVYFNEQPQYDTPLPIVREETVEPCVVANGLDWIEKMTFSTYCRARDLYIKKHGSKSNLDTISYEEILNSRPQIVTAGEFSSNTFFGRNYLEKLFKALAKGNSKLQKLDCSGTDGIAIYYATFLDYCLKADLESDCDLSAYSSILPAFIYKPTIQFDRARLQKGIFVYQPYRIDYKTNLITPFPNILTDMAIKVRIKNTKQILAELNNININLGTLFGDYDNIAKHIKNNIAVKEEN